MPTFCTLEFINTRLCDRVYQIKWINFKLQNFLEEKSCWGIDCIQMRYNFYKPKPRITKKYLPLICIVSFLLHNLQNFLASIGAVFWIAINRDSLFQRSNVILSMDVNSSSGLLCYLSDCGTLSSNNSSYLKKILHQLYY